MKKIVSLTSVALVLLCAPSAIGAPSLSYKEARQADQSVNAYPVVGCHREGGTSFLCRVRVDPEVQGHEFKIPPYSCYDRVYLRYQDIAVRHLHC